MNAPVERVLDALQASGRTTKKVNGQWMAQCPGHDDRSPSLAIRDGEDGRALLHCHAGCPTDLVVGALGLNVVELFDGPDRPAAPTVEQWPAYRAALREGAADRRSSAAVAAPAQELVTTTNVLAATYVYTDADGTPVARSVRYNVVDKATGVVIGKTFRQHAADGHGGWHRGLNNITPPLYRLPAVRAAIAASAVVMVVEGEKDADRAAALGFAGTCNPMGAGAWKDVHTQALAGCNVLLVPDRDQAGIEHARAVCAALLTAGATVAVFGPAEGKDLSDHLDAGHGIGDLIPVDLAEPDPFLQPAADQPQPTADPAADALLARLVDNELRTQRARRTARAMLDNEEAVRSFRVPAFQPNLTAELALPEEPVTYLITDLFPAGANTTLTAQFKAGKTTTVNHLIRCLADGEPFLGRFDVNPPTGRIAVFNYEVDERQYRRWLREVGIRKTDHVSVLNLRGYRLPLTVEHIENWVVEWLHRHDIAVWIVDPFARAFVGSGEENSNSDVGRWLDTLDVIKERSGVTELLMPVHTGRDSESSDRARGATRLDDWADVRWILTKDDEDERYFRATGRDVEIAEEKVTYDPTSRGMTFGGGDKAWEASRRIERAVLDVVAQRPGILSRELREAVRALTHGSSKGVDRARDRLISAGSIYTLAGAHNSMKHYPGRGPND